MDNAHHTFILLERRRIRPKRRREGVDATQITRDAKANGEVDAREVKETKSVRAIRIRCIQTTLYTYTHQRTGSLGWIIHIYAYANTHPRI